MQKRKMLCLLGSMLVLSATGCGKKAATMDEANVQLTEYVKMEYETELVKKGDMTPEITLKLTANAFEKESYRPFKDELKVEQVNCVRGDAVKAGDVLVTFSSGDIEEQISAYVTRIEEDYLLIEHYKKLAEIDPDTDYSVLIDDVNRDLAVQSLYKKEAEANLSNYRIVAKGNGVVTQVSELLSYGIVNSSDMVLSVIYGDGGYSVTTTEDISFLAEGKVYEATYGNASFEFVLERIEDTDQETAKTLYFSLAGDENRILDYSSLNMTLQKPTLQNVLYVPERAVFSVDEQNYVYVMNENGFREGRKITILTVVNGNVIISEGLLEGERVVISN